MGIFIIQDTAWEDQDAIVRWRAEDGNDAAYQTADLDADAFKYDAFSRDDPSTPRASDVALTVVATANPAVGEIAIYDTPKTTEGWSNTKGFNFKTKFPASLLPTGEEEIVIEVFATPSAEGANQFMLARIHLNVANIYGG